MQYESIMIDHKQLVVRHTQVLQKEGGEGTSMHPGLSIEASHWQYIADCFTSKQRLKRLSFYDKETHLCNCVSKACYL